MLPRSFGDQIGVVTRRRAKGQQKLLAQANSHRGNLTYIAIICDDTSIQPRLPQVLVGAEHVLRVKDLKTVQNLVPANVYLIRRKSGWLDNVLFAQIVKWLRAAVSQIDPHIQILLLLDTSPVHLHKFVLKTAKEQRVRLCFVPASATWLLQPCDTHLFRKFKAQLAALFRKFRVQHGMTHVPLTELILMIIKLIRKVVQGSRWQTAFKSNGYTLHQIGVSERILNNLEPSVCLRCTSVFPDKDNVRNALPANCKVDIDRLKCFALDGMAYTAQLGMTPRGQVDIVPGEDAQHCRTQNSDGSLFMLQDSPMDSQTSWAGRLRPLPSRIVAANDSASASQEPPEPAYPSLAASSSQPCPSLMMQPGRIHRPQQQPTAALDRPHVPKARAMAMPRRRP